MKFEYKKYGPGTLRPVIPVAIGVGDFFIPYEVLVDSGADGCIFDAQIADILGIDTRSGEPQIVFGITGAEEIYYSHPVTLKVGGWPYRVKVGFMSNMPAMGYGVVGQYGFFDKFVVRFDLSKKEIELKDKKTVA